MSSLNDGDAVPVAIQDPQRVLLLEVLPLDHAAGPDLVDAGDERLDQRVVLGAAQPGRAVAEVQRIGEQGRVVGADVERDRQGQRGMDAAGRRVQRELADRDGHAAGALVAEAQDALVVGHDDQPDVLVRALAQELRDPVDVGRRDPGAAGPPDDVAEFLAGPPDGRGVDDRQELVEVLGEEPVEQRRVAILEGRQADVLLERVVLDPEVLEFEVESAPRWSGRDPAAGRAARMPRARPAERRGPSSAGGCRAGPGPRARSSRADRRRWHRTGRAGDARSRA